MRKLILASIVALVAALSLSITPVSAGENPNSHKIDGITVGLVHEQEAKLQDMERGKKRLVEKSGGVTIACTDQLWSDDIGHAVSGIFSEWGYKTRRKPVVNVVANFAITVCEYGECNTTYEYVDPANVNYAGGVLTMYNDHHSLKCQDREGGYLYQSYDRSRWFNNQGSAGQNKNEYQYRDVDIHGAWHPDLGDSVFHQQYLQVWTGDSKQSHPVNETEPGGGKG